MTAYPALLVNHAVCVLLQVIRIGNREQAADAYPQPISTSGVHPTMTELQAWILIGLVAMAAWGIYWKLVTIDENQLSLLHAAVEAESKLQDTLSRIHNELISIESNLRSTT